MRTFSCSHLFVVPSPFRCSGPVQKWKVVHAFKGNGYYCEPISTYFAVSYFDLCWNQWALKQKIWKESYIRNWMSLFKLKSSAGVFHFWSVHGSSFPLWYWKEKLLGSRGGANCLLDRHHDSKLFSVLLNSIWWVRSLFILTSPRRFLTWARISIRRASIVPSESPQVSERASLKLRKLVSPFAECSCNACYHMYTIFALALPVQPFKKYFLKCFLRGEKKAIQNV